VLAWRTFNHWSSMGKLSVSSESTSSASGAEVDTSQERLNKEEKKKARSSEKVKVSRCLLSWTRWKKQERINAKELLANFSPRLALSAMGPWDIEFAMLEYKSLCLLVISSISSPLASGARWSQSSGASYHRTFRAALVTLMPSSSDSAGYFTARGLCIAWFVGSFSLLSEKVDWLGVIIEDLDSRN